MSVVPFGLDNGMFISTTIACTAAAGSESRILFLALRIDARFGG